MKFDTSHNTFFVCTSPSLLNVHPFRRKCLTSPSRETLPLWIWHWFSILSQTVRFLLLFRRCVSWVRNSRTPSFPTSPQILDLLVQGLRNTHSFSSKFYLNLSTIPGLVRPVTSRTIYQVRNKTFRRIVSLKFTHPKLRADGLKNGVELRSDGYTQSVNNTWWSPRDRSTQDSQKSMNETRSPVTLSVEMDPRSPETHLVGPLGNGTQDSVNSRKRIHVRTTPFLDGNPCSRSLDYGVPHLETGFSLSTATYLRRGDGSTSLVLSLPQRSGSLVNTKYGTTPEKNICHQEETDWVRRKDSNVRGSPLVVYT